MTVTVIALVLSVPLWIDPMTLRELSGGTSSAPASPSPAATSEPSRVAE